MPKKGVLQKITRSAYYYKDGSKYKPLYSHKYMKDYPSTGRKSYVIYRKTRDTKGKPFYGRFYRKSEILTKSNKNYSKKKIITRRAKRKTQRGGLVPCIPCILPAAKIVTPAAVAVAGAAATYFSRKSSSSRTMKNGTETLKRTETYEMKNKHGEIETKKFIQNGKRVMKITNDKKIYDKKFDTTEDATNHIEKAIKRCKKRGFKKC